MGCVRTLFHSVFWFLSWPRATEVRLQLSRAELRRRARCVRAHCWSFSERPQIKEFSCVNFTLLVRCQRQFQAESIGAGFLFVSQMNDKTPRMKPHFISSAFLVERKRLCLCPRLSLGLFRARLCLSSRWCELLLGCAEPRGAGVSTPKHVVFPLCL